MRTKPPIFNVPSSVGLMIFLLAAIHVFYSVLGGRAASLFLYRFAFIPARYSVNGDFFPGGPGAEVWTLLSYAFLHGDFLHLAINAVWLAGFGSALARRFGALRFITLFLLGSAGGAVAHFIAMPDDTSPLIGASAGVSAIMAATIRFAFAPGGPLAGGRGRPESFHIAAPTLLAALANRQVFAFVLVWFMLNLMFGVQNIVQSGAGNLVAWQAHIGGFLVGLLLFTPLDPVSMGHDKSAA